MYSYRLPGLSRHVRVLMLAVDLWVKMALINIPALTLESGERQCSYFVSCLLLSCTGFIQESRALAPQSAAFFQLQGIIRHPGVQGV